MTHLGSPSDWCDLLDSQVPAILDLVADTWERISTPAANELEDAITNRLCAALQNHPHRADHPFHIQPQTVVLEPDSGAELGRLDISFKPFVPSDEIYFCLECKRLNVTTADEVRGYHAEYVRHGMLRFVRGQYASAVRHGGMLGYVLNGDISGAVSGIEGNIRALHPDLGMHPPGGFRESSLRPTDPMARETAHRRALAPDRFTIHHLFVPGNPNAPMLPDATGTGPSSARNGPGTPPKTAQRRTRKNSR